LTIRYMLDRFCTVLKPEKGENVHHQKL